MRKEPFLPNDIPSGRDKRPEDDVASRLYTAVHEELTTNGFEHYEISNFARLQGSSKEPSPFRSRHNQGYWSRRPYAAFGNGAASFVHSVRATRPRDVGEYCSWVEKGGTAEGLAEVDASPRDDPREPMCEALMLGLRTLDGVHIVVPMKDTDAVACVEAVAKALESWMASGHAHVCKTPRTEEAIDEPHVELQARLEAPHGFVISDTIISDALAALISVPQQTS